MLPVPGIHKLISRRWARWAAVALAGLLAVIVAAVAALPSLVRWGLQRGLEQATGMRASVGDVAIVRRSGEARIGEVRLVHPRSGKQVGGWDRISGRLWYPALLLGIVRFEELVVDRPFVALVRGGDRPDGDAIPLSVFAAQQSQSRLTPGVHLRRLAVNQGRITLFDAVGEGGTVRVEDLTVRASDLATGEGGSGRQASLEVSARWEGGHVEVTGWAKPSAQPPEADLSVRVVDLDLSLVDALLSAAGGSGRGRPVGPGGPAVAALPVAIRSGRADASARFTQGHAGVAQATATLTLRRPEVELSEGRGRVAAQAFQVVVGGFDLDSLTLRDARVEVQAGEANLPFLDGTVGRMASLRADVGSFDLRKRSLESVTLEARGVAASRGQGTWSVEGARLRVAADALDLRARTARGLTAEAERVVGSGLGMADLKVEARAIRAAADGVTQAAATLQGISLAVEGASATGPRGPLGTVGAVRASAAAVEPATRSGAGVRVEAEQVALAGVGPQGVSAGLRALRAGADRVDLEAPALRGASLALEWLAAARAGEPEPFMVLRAARLEAPRVDLAAPAIDVTRLVVDAPTLQVRRDAGGIDLARLLPPQSGAQGSLSAPPGAEASGGTPAAGVGAAAPGGDGRLPSIPLSAVSVGLVQLGEGSVTFSDATVSPAARVDVRELAVNLVNVRPGGDAPATLVASAKLGRAGRFEMGAQFTPGTLRNANGTARLEGIDVDVARPYLQLPAPFAAITGRVTASAEARPAASAPPPTALPAPAAAPRPAWKVVARVEARDLAGRDEAKRALAEVPSLDLKDIEVAVPDLAVSVGEITVGGFRVPVERDAAGVVRVAGMSLSALQARGAAMASRAAVPVGTPPAPASGRALPPLRVRHVRLVGSIPLVDRARRYPLETALSDLILELQDVGTVGDTAMGLQVSGRLEEMTFAGAGTTRLDPLQGTAYLEVKSLDVVRWADYLPDPIRGRLADLRGHARLEATFGPSLEDLAVRGAVNADQLQLADLQGDGILGVERAEIAIERLTLAPLALHVRSALLLRPWVRVELRADRRLNLLDLLSPGPAGSGGGTGPAAGPAPPPAGPAAAAAAAMPITIDDVIVREGIFTVVDRTVTPAFRERLEAVAMSIEGIKPGGQAATFKLEGRFRDKSSLSIKGSAAPRMDPVSLEVKASLDDFNLSALSTYLRHLTSHRLERGKFNLKASYSLEGRKLDGKNEVRIEQLQVGEAEEWPDKFTEQVGVSLPFAVSLLEDGDGVIKLEVPVKGDVAAPEFDLGEAIRTAVGHAVVSVVMAPFRMVGHIIEAAGRIEAVRIDPILFEPGSDQLSGPAREALSRLVKYLTEVPGARIEVVGYAEPEQDGKALAARTPQPGGATGLVRRLAARLGGGAGRPAAPTPAALQGLARRRGLAANEALLRAKVEPQRLFLREPVVEAADKAAERGQPPQGRVEFRIVP